MVGFLAAALAASAPGRADPLDDQLAARWEGRWVVLKTEIASVCGEAYTNNRLRGGQVDTGKGGWERRLQRFGRFLAERTVGEDEVPSELAEALPFAAGELAAVRRLRVGNQRVDLSVDLQGRRLLPYEHGPFTLFHEARCKVELQFEVPREIVKRGDLGELEEILTHAVERYDSERQARDSNRWNRRGDDAYPEDYDETLRRYVAWRNAEIDRGLRDAMDLIAGLAARLGATSGYFDGFFRGVERIEPVLARRSCERLVGVDAGELLQKPGMGVATTASGLAGTVTVDGPSGESESTVVVDRQAFEDGQRLRHALAVLERLPGCRLPAEEAGCG